VKYMKKIKMALSALALVACFSACSKKNNGSSNPAASDVYARCGNDQNCINQYFSQQYGPNGGAGGQGYYQGNTNCGGGYQCGVYNVPNYQQGCNYGGCGQQQYVSVPQGAYMPQQGIYGQGGSYFSGSVRW
jgi:hypothetical protein